MRSDLLKTIRLIALSTLMLVAMKGFSEPVRWDFSGTFNGTWGTGNPRPGLVPGASFTGSAIADTSRIYLVSSYHGYWGWISIYRDPSSFLTYTASYNGESYTYTYWDLDFAVTAHDGEQSYRVEIDGPMFLMAKDVFQAQLPDLTFPSFLSGMAYESVNSSTSVIIAENMWANSVVGSLQSLDQAIGSVPEPSTIGVLSLGGFVALVYQRSRTRLSQRSKLSPME